MQLGKGNRYLHEICHDSIAIYNLSIPQLLSEQYVELPTVFNGVANTSCTLTGQMGGGCAGSHEVAGKGYVFTKNSQMVSNGAIFTLTYHTKQLNPWLNSSTSHVVNYCQLSAFQRNMEPFEGNLSTRGRLTSLRNKPQQMQPGEISLSMNGRIFS